MGDGGRPHARLRALRPDFAMSQHGVGLPIGGEGALDTAPPGRLKTLIDRLEPASFSEHLAWSTHGAEFLDDLLPLPYDQATLARVAEHIDQVQQHLGRRMLLENPSSHLAFATSTLSELVRKTGCGLLRDVNNLFISATNPGYAPHNYQDVYPLAAVREIHVGGHAHDRGEHGAPLLIHSYASKAADPVRDLPDCALASTAPAPVLVEWEKRIQMFRSIHHVTPRAACTSLVHPRCIASPSTIRGRFIRAGWAPSSTCGVCARCTSDSPRHVVDRVLSSASPKLARARAMTSTGTPSARTSTNRACGSALIALRQVSQVFKP